MNVDIATDGAIEITYSYAESVAKGWLSKGGIFLPGHPLFTETLNTPSADIITGLRFGHSSNQRHIGFGADGLMKQFSKSELDDYFQSGEYDQRLSQIGEH